MEGYQIEIPSPSIIWRGFLDETFRKCNVTVVSGAESILSLTVLGLFAVII